MSGVSWVGFYEEIVNLLSFHGVDRLRDFEVRSLVNLLNPLFVVALYRSAITYLFTGREVYSVPMISLGGGVRYVGWPRYILTPFGPEWGVENLFSRNGQQLRLTFRISDGIGASTVGGGVRVKKLFRSDRDGGSASHPTSWT